MMARVRDERVDLAPELAPVGQRDIDHVARDRDHRDGLRDRVERDDDHRVGQVGVAPDARIDPDDQAVDARHGRRRRGQVGRGRLGRGGVGRARVGCLEVVRVGLRCLRRTDGDRRRLDEDLVDRLARDLGGVAAVGLRDDDEEQDEGDRHDVAPAGARQGRVPDARPDGQQAPDEEQRLDREEAPDDLGREEFRHEARRRRRQDDPEPDRERDDDRGQEQDRAATAAGREVAEPGDQRVKDGRHVARAASNGVGVGRWGRWGR